MLHSEIICHAFHASFKDKNNRGVQSWFLNSILHKIIKFSKNEISAASKGYHQLSCCLYIIHVGLMILCKMWFKNQLWTPQLLLFILNHQGTIHGTSLSSAIAYIRSIFGLNHGVCWLNATCVYAAKIKLNHCGTN